MLGTLIILKYAQHTLFVHCHVQISSTSARQVLGSQMVEVSLMLSVSKLCDRFYSHIAVCSTSLICTLLMHSLSDGRGDLPQVIVTMCH